MVAARTGPVLAGSPARRQDRAISRASRPALPRTRTAFSNPVGSQAAGVNRIAANGGYPAGGCHSAAEKPSTRASAIGTRRAMHRTPSTSSEPVTSTPAREDGERLGAGLKVTRVTLVDQSAPRSGRAGGLRADAEALDRLGGSVLAPLRRTRRRPRPDRMHSLPAHCNAQLAHSLHSAAYSLQRRAKPLAPKGDSPHRFPLTDS